MERNLAIELIDFLYDSPSDVSYTHLDVYKRQVQKLEYN